MLSLEQEAKRYLNERPIDVMVIMGEKKSALEESREIRNIGM